MELLSSFSLLNSPSATSTVPFHSCSQAFLSASSRKQLFGGRGTPKAIGRRVATPRCSSTEEEVNRNRPSVVDRRQLLLASTLGVAGLPSCIGYNPALGAPVQPPTLKQCTTPIVPGNGAPSVDCCLPVSTTITDYRLPEGLPLRVRPSAHFVSKDYTAKYTKAYELLRNLPSTDPRQYSQQANVHCAFCDASYDENGTTIEYQVHFSWLFFPWHRWYLYFHERILASLINDPSFSLPFWNWDSASGNTLPPLYANTSSSLYDSNRNPAHASPAVVDLNYNFTESGLSASAQLASNNALMYRQVVSGSKTPSLFFGQAYRQGDAASPGAGNVENSPHGNVHSWTGNPANPNDEDMGTLYSAGRDAIFYAHHGNIDRLWEVWKSLGGRRKDISDPDWLDATFPFYDENAKLVRVRIGDALETSKLGYKYEDVPNPWLKAKAKKSKGSRATASASASAVVVNGGPGASTAPAMGGIIKDKVKEEVEEFKEKLRKFKKGLKEFKDRESNKVEKTLSALVKRPKKVKADDYEEEILVFEGVQIPTDEKVKFDVYINLGDEDESVGSDISEYAGSFFNVPHLGMKMGEGKRIRKSNFRLGIGEVLKELGIEDDDDFSVTVIPRSQTSFPISIDAVKLEYE